MQQPRDLAGPAKSMRLLLQPRPLPGDILVGEPARLGAQHVCDFLARHVNLVADGHEAVGEVEVVVAHESEGHHVVVDVVEDEGATVAVGGFGLEEVNGLLAPVAAGVEVVGCVVAVVEAETVALCRDQ